MLHVTYITGRYICKYQYIYLLYGDWLIWLTKLEERGLVARFVI